MCLRVDANGTSDAKGKYLSVFGYIMRSNFYIHLKWPFQGDVMVTLVNQLQDKEHFTYIINFRNARTSAARRVTTGERAQIGWGAHEFLPQSEVGHDPPTKCQYLKDDCRHSSH